MAPEGQVWGAAYGTPYQIITSNPAVCTATASIGSEDKMIITPVAVSPGDCTITILRPESAYFVENRVDWQIRVMVIKSYQVIVFPAFAAPAIGQSVTLSATGGASGNPVTFSSPSAGICSVEGNALTALAAGTCTVIANQLGNDRFNEAEQQNQTVTIAAAAAVEPAVPVEPGAPKTPQRITFGNAPRLYWDNWAVLTATGGGSGNPVTFSSLTPDICRVSGNIVVAIDTGYCEVAADQVGNETYAAAEQVTQFIRVTHYDVLDAASTAPRAAARVKKNVVVKNLAPGTMTEQILGIVPIERLGMGAAVTLSAFGGDSGNPVRLSSLTPNVCTVNDTTLNAVTTGTCTIAADQDGNDLFYPASQITMDVNIVQEILPYAVTVNIAGDLTAQTLTANIQPDTKDLGRVGNEFLVARLGDFMVLYGPNGWVQYTDASSLVALSSGVLSSRELTLLENIDMTPMIGAYIYVGYGLGFTLEESYAEMMQAKRMMPVYTID